MTEIPRDVMAAAFAVIDRGYEEGMAVTIAHAILAERERCAKVCERINNEYGPYEAGLATECRDAIRSGK